MSAPPALANVLRPHGDYAIIGPGGGVDVLRAVGNGSPSVTGIEINPIIANTIMRGRYADYTFHLYQQPEVHIHVTDGRSFVRNAQQQFDVVQMTLVDTWASTAAGAFALSENSLYTVEAFREYFEHLKPDGMIAITRWEFQQPREALRVVSVAMQALHEMGVANPAGNFIVVSEGHLDADGIPVVVLAKRSAFTAEEVDQVKQHLAVYPKLFLLYAPPDPALAAGNMPARYSASAESFSQLIQANDPQKFAERYPYDVSPVTDNAPFFFFTLKLDQILHPKALQRGIDWKSNLGVAVLGMVLVISLLAVLVFLVLPLAMGARGQQPRPLRLLYFVAVGLGYILVEIAFIQRFVLFLGHPVYALTVVVFLLLLSSGAGSMVSRWWLAETSRVWLPLLLIAAALLLYVGVLPGLLGRAGGLAFRGQAAGQRRASGSVGLRHGHAVPHRAAGPGGAAGSELPVVAAGQTQRKYGGVGVGHECSFQRPGLSPGHHDCHPVWLECHIGLRGRGLSGCPPVGDYVASRPPDGVIRPRGLLLFWANPCRCHGERPLLGRMRA